MLQQNDIEFNAFTISCKTKRLYTVNIKRYHFGCLVDQTRGVSAKAPNY